MPSFKPKTTKKLRLMLNSNVTLDGKHKEMVSKFNEEEENYLNFYMKKRTETKTCF